jgi:ketosteroid isomerase-like protein
MPPHNNVELVRQAMEVWNREDVDGFMAMSDPDVEFVSIFAGLEGRTYRGRAGLQEYFADMRDAWAEFQRDIEDVIDAGENQVVVFFHLRAIARASGVSMDQQVTTVFRLREGRLSRMVVFRDRAKALESTRLRTSGEAV